MMMTSLKSVYPYTSLQIYVNVVKYYFQFEFCYFKDISDKVAADDDVIMHDDVIFKILC